jgi:site-specific recombinase XerD
MSECERVVLSERSTARVAIAPPAGGTRTANAHGERARARAPAGNPVPRGASGAVGIVAGMNTQTQRSALGSELLAGQLDVDEVLELVVRGERPPPPAVVGELVAPAAELVDVFAATLVARPQTQRTYARACRRFVRWLGALAGPEDLTAANVARYHAHLVAGGRSSATVKKDRAALNSFLRWLAEHERVPAAQVREALAVRLPRAECSERELPKALGLAQYERLIREAKARIADDPLAGARDLAIVLVLGDAGLRCEELAELERRDFLPARKGAQLRALDVRHGKGDRQRRVKLGPDVARAIVRWDRERTRAFGAPAADGPLFITLGKRRRDGSYTRVGGRCGQAVLADVLKRLGAAAALPDELRHPHALRHTCATELLRAGATVADVRVFLGHASVKTTSIYLASGEDRQEHVVLLRQRGRTTLDDDRDAG